MNDYGFTDYENYMELYEAVYFFDRINYCTNYEKTKALGISEGAYQAAARILVVNKLLDYDGSCFVLTDENKEQLQHILDSIINKNQNKHYAEFFDKAISNSQFFFNSISELEYEIYSRCNFQVTFETGKKVAGHINLSNKKVLELGGNSGGLGSALLTKYNNCSYTVVDTKIPCMVGTEFNEQNEQNITFIEGDVFKLALPNELYDYIVIMNLLHDFDDIKCLDILRSCTKHCGKNTKFLIIEDILTSQFEPKQVIMHGLRLAIECRGGKQRTAEELANLFSDINYKLEKTIKLDSIHTMLVFGS